MKTLLTLLLLSVTCLSQHLGGELILTNPSFTGNINGWSQAAGPVDTWTWVAGDSLHMAEDGNAEGVLGGTDEIAVKINRMYRFVVNYRTVTAQTQAISNRISQSVGSGNDFGMGATNYFSTTPGLHSDVINFKADETNTGAVYWYNPTAKAFDIYVGDVSCKTYKTYYVSTTGNNSNNGITSITPRLDFASAGVGFVHETGDSIKFKSGDSFAGSFTCSAAIVMDIYSGSSNVSINSVDFGNYSVSINYNIYSNISTILNDDNVTVFNQPASIQSIKFPKSEKFTGFPKY